jgi:hypothetical protein
MLCRVVRQKLTNVSDVLTDSIILVIALMMVAVSISETSVNFYQTTRHNIPRGSHLQTRQRDNLKSNFLNVLIYRIKIHLYRFSSFCHFIFHDNLHIQHSNLQDFKWNRKLITATQYSSLKHTSLFLSAYLYNLNFQEPGATNSYSWKRGEGDS